MSSARRDLIAEIIGLIGRTNELATRMRQTAAGMIGVNATDLLCVQLLQHGPLSAGDLASRTRLSTASITTVIDRLEAAGFVARTRDAADRRRVVVALQPDKARTDVAPVFQPLVRAWRAAMAGYDDQDLRLIADFLVRIDEAFEAELARLPAVTRRGISTATGAEAAPPGQAHSRRSNRSR